MSARSRALEDLTAHFRALRDGAAGELDPHAPPAYNAYELWDRAADMAFRTAEDSAWSARVGRFFRRWRWLPRAKRDRKAASAQVLSVPGIRVADIDWNQVRQTFRQSATCWDHRPSLPYERDPDGRDWTTCLNCGRDLLRRGDLWVVGLLRRSGPVTQEESNGE